MFSGPSETAREDADAGDQDPSLGAGDGRLEVLGEAAVASEPGEGAFDHPSLGLGFQRAVYLRLGSQNSRAAKISATPISSVSSAITLMRLGAGMGCPRCGRRGSVNKRAPGRLAPPACDMKVALAGSRRSGHILGRTGPRTALVAYQSALCWQAAPAICRLFRTTPTGTCIPS